MHLIDDLDDGQSSASRVCVLVVEDDAVSRAKLEALGAQLGVETVGVASLIDARVAMRERGFDAAVIDVGLPDGSGLSLVPDLLGAQPPCACVVLTGSDDYGVVQRAVRLGVTQFLRKPAGVHQIRQALAMAFHRSRMLRGWLGEAPEGLDASELPTRESEPQP